MSTSLSCSCISLCVQTLSINPDKMDITSFTMEDFTLEGYEPHASIAMTMAV